MKKSLRTNRLVVRRLDENNPYDFFGIVNLFEKRDTAWWADLLEPILFIDDAREFIHNNNAGRVSLYGIFEKGEPWLLGAIQVEISSYSNLSYAEVGYALSYEGRGKGYMTEALKAICEMLFDMPGMVEVRCHILWFNESSLAVAERCGFKPVDEPLNKKEVRLHMDYYLDEYVIKGYEYRRDKEGFDNSYLDGINAEEDLYEQIAS